MWENWQQKNLYLKEIELHAQIVLTILGLIANIIGGPT